MRLEALPGARSVALTSDLPGLGGGHLAPDDRGRQLCDTSGLSHRQRKGDQIWIF